MTHLYISTDASEAEELIEKTSIHSKPKYVYTDISSREGTKISKEIKRKMGIPFNPMCCVDLGKESTKLVGDITNKLVDKGLHVFWLDDEDGWRRQTPSDDSARENLVKLALKSRSGYQFDVGGIISGNLLVYSNDPSKIRADLFWPSKHGLAYRA
jgi:hypothetical protein